MKFICSSSPPLPVDETSLFLNDQRRRLFHHCSCTAVTFELSMTLTLLFTEESFQVTGKICEWKPAGWCRGFFSFTNFILEPDFAPK